MRLLLQILALFASLFSSEVSTAAAYIAEVINIRGIATQLSPGALMARELKVNDRVVEDTSIVTYDKSFVRLRYDDGSQLSLGPRGKAILSHYDKKGMNVVNLLKGRLRAKVNEEKKYTTKNKFFVKTRSAALGVRGTEFHTIYNPHNQHTSLVTYKGEVAIARTPQATDLPAQNSSSKSEFDGTNEQMTHKPEDSKPDDFKPEDLEKSLSKEGVTVPAGQYSGVVGGLVKPTLPVQINPVQLNALYANADMKEKMTYKEVAYTDAASAIENPIAVAPPTVSPEGFYDPKKGLFAPKAGGIIDLESGIYVQPSAESIYDAATGLYVPLEAGHIDSETGQYIPPKGIRLDPKKGFVLKNDTGDDEGKLLALSTQLNTVIAQDIILERPKELPIFRLPSVRELFLKNNVTLSAKVTSESMSVDNDTTYGSKSYDASGGKSFDLLWEHEAPTNYQFITRFGWNSVEFDKKDDITVAQGSTHLLTMGIGAKLFYTLRSYFLFEGRLSQKHFVKYSASEASAHMQKGNITEFRASYNRRYIERKKWFLEGEFGGAYLASKTVQDLEVASGYGYFLNASWKYFLGFNSLMGLNFSFENQSQSISGTSQTNDVSRRDIGFGILAGAVF